MTGRVISFDPTFSFLRGRLRTLSVRDPRTFEERFHSFEVGFGPLDLLEPAYLLNMFSFLRGRLRTSSSAATKEARRLSFHSFEVGFGRKPSLFLSQADSRFHSFEVGFGRK